MPIPGTKGLGEEILKYTTALKKAECDESSQNDERSCRETGGQETSMTMARPARTEPVNTKEDKQIILDTRLMNARNHLLRLIKNKKRRPLDDQMNAITDTITMHPELCQVNLGEHERLLLHIAARRGYPLPVLELLVSLYPEALLKQDTFGRTPLNLSLENNRCEPEILRLLACPEVLSINDQYGNSILHKYCQCGDIDMQVFREFVNTNPQSLGQTNTHDGHTPLHVLIDSDTEMDDDLFDLLLEFLLEQHPVAVEMRDAEGFTPLHIVCMLHV